MRPKRLGLLSVSLRTGRLTFLNMREKGLFGAAVLLATLLCSGRSRGHGFEHSAALDAGGRYVVKWKFDETSITFEIEAETMGYIGFGLSPNGAMASADLVIGGVANGIPYLHDYFSDSSRVVHKDPVQSYKLLYGKENHTHTVLAFSRDLQTCDPKDRDITSGTMRVIWALHSEDVGPSGPKYHGINRGRKSLRFLNPGTSRKVPPETATVDLLNVNVPVPDKDTTYWCQMFKMPEVQKKHHIIRIEPLIQKGHENLVHHILLYQCDSSLNESELDMGHECFHPNMPDSFTTCETVIFAWAIGGEGFTYPVHVGMSIGTDIDPVYVLMEVHYDNPALQTEVVDSSGLRLYYTPRLRTYDAGVIETGVWVSLYHMLPPGMQDYITEGHCTQECLQESLDSEMPSGVWVFAVLLHAHLAGRAIRTRHFREQVELPPLASDDQFDFNFQEFQPLSPERLILPGDSLITECIYNTKDRRNMTWGGLSTRDEMCLSYLLYYPRINLARCESLPEITGQLKFIGVKQIQSPLTTWPFVIKSPKRYSNLSFTEAMDKFRWTKKRAKAFNEVVLNLPMNVRCSKIGLDEWAIQGMIVSPPKPKSVRPPAVATCMNGSECQWHCTISYILITALMVLLQFNSQL
ncbi:LOW QUALITY PROTEIN: DBH-like monooxygenase protein 1 homolog [Colossoma macropomum]|uniref:LOW QUALITY PROTEIN: DBH-like monooxygenase protein 1 homolog n=1 Tax=Colossoma macropomum TaxID=42526 RepID=UPI0018641467|nr:LOW QUALITY PROTEIN: DBH-like monooxygenase protein 1 homolog [Colossoma macropomum]